MWFIISIVFSFSTFADFGFFEQIATLDKKDVKSRIFQIYTPAGQYSSLPLSNKPVLLQGMQSYLEQGQIDSIQYKAVMFQLRYCEAKKMDPCLLFLDVVKGTAFTAGEPGMVWTAFHNVTGAAINAVGQQIVENGTKDYQAVLQFMKQGSFPLYLLDEHGNVLLEPKLDESNWAHNLMFPYENIAEYFDGGEPTAERDFAGFMLPTLSIEPLPIAETFEIGQSVFLGGYPAATGSRKSRFNGLDSDGQGFYYGKGQVLDLNSFLLRQSIQASPSEDMQIRRSRQVLTSADAFAGHSGSPFLNEKGEVLGVFVEYLPIWTPTPNNNTSYGPSFSYIFEVLQED